MLFSDVAMMPGHMFTLVEYCQCILGLIREDCVPGNVSSMFDVLEETMKELKDELNSHDSAVRRAAHGIAALKKLKKKRKLAADKKAGKLDRLSPMFPPRAPVFPPPLQILLDNGYAFEQAVYIRHEHRNRLKSRLAPPSEPPSEPPLRNIGFVHMCSCEAAAAILAPCICAHETPLQFLNADVRSSEVS
jgi:hypothetical protein